MTSYPILPSSPRAPLTRTPIEVLLQITYHLTTPELCNLRLACKALETSLLESFTKEFFTKRQFMLSTFSLQAFLDISRSRFAYCLNHVILGSEQLSAHPLGVHPYLRDPNSDFSLQVDPLRLRQELIDRKLMMNSGQDIELLAEAFSNLTNFQTVGLRDFYSRSRRRDYPNTEWRSYGVKTLELATGARLTLHDIHNYQNSVDSNYIERMFLNVLRALGRATSHPKNFEVILRHKRLEDFAFTVPQHVLPAVQSTLLDLRTIFLDLWQETFPTQVLKDGKQIPCPNYQLRLFLARLPQLEHLRLNFHAAIVSPDATEEDFLLWLGNANPPTCPQAIASTSPPTAPPAIPFANLKQLDLGHFKAKPQTLLAIVAKYQTTLRGISFHEATLSLRLRNAGTNNYAAHTIDDDDEDKPKPNYWATFFSQLSKLEQLNLSSMTLSRIRVEEERFSHNCVFSNNRDPRVRHWAGNNIQSGLRDLAASVWVDRPGPEIVASRVDAESEGSDEYGDDDDDDHDSEDDGSGEDDDDEDNDDS